MLSGDVDEKAMGTQPKYRTATPRRSTVRSASRANVNWPMTQARYETAIGLGIEVGTRPPDPTVNAGALTESAPCTSLLRA